MCVNWLPVRWRNDWYCHIHTHCKHIYTHVTGKRVYICSYNVAWNMWSWVYKKFVMIAFVEYCTYIYVCVTHYVDYEFHLDIWYILTLRFNAVCVWWLLSVVAGTLGSEGYGLKWICLCQREGRDGNAVLLYGDIHMNGGIGSAEQQHQRRLRVYMNTLNTWGFLCTAHYMHAHIQSIIDRGPQSPYLKHQSIFVFSSSQNYICIPIIWAWGPFVLPCKAHLF